MPVPISNPHAIAVEPLSLYFALSGTAAPVAILPLIPPHLVWSHPSYEEDDEPGEHEEPQRSELRATTVLRRRPFLCSYSQPLSSATLKKSPWTHGVFW